MRKQGAKAPCYKDTVSKAHCQYRKYAGGADMENVRMVLDAAIILMDIALIVTVLRRWK